MTLQRETLGGQRPSPGTSSSSARYMKLLTGLVPGRLCPCRDPAAVRQRWRPAGPDGCRQGVHSLFPCKSSITDRRAVTNCGRGVTRHRRHRRPVKRKFKCAVCSSHLIRPASLSNTHSERLDLTQHTHHLSAHLLTGGPSLLSLDPAPLESPSVRPRARPPESGQRRQTPSPDATAAGTGASAYRSRLQTTAGSMTSLTAGHDPATNAPGRGAVSWHSAITRICELVRGCRAHRLPHFS